jgi:adenosine kinase
MRREFGGCAGNIAYSAKLLGDEAYPMATAGSDFAPYADWMRRHGVPQDYVRVIDSEFTAQAFITTDLDDNQITAFHPGAMQQSHLNQISAAGRVTLGIVSPDGREGMIAHAAQFAAADIPFIFDPGQGLPMYGREDLQRFIEQASWVTVNDYEWSMIQQKTGWSERDVLAHVQALIVTRGADGSVIHTPAGTIAIPAARPQAVVDPTGCGDAYRAGLMHGLSRGLDWPVTGRIAALIGALKIETLGPQNHRFTRDEFRARYAESFGSELPAAAL